MRHGQFGGQDGGDSVRHDPRLSRSASRTARTASRKTAEITVTPARNFDLGEGKGKEIQRTVQGGVAGVIIDTRGRPLQIPTEDNARIAKMKEWLTP